MIVTVGYPRNENIFKLISSNHGMVVKDGSSCDISVEDIISDVIESLLPCLVLIHVEGIVDFCCEYALSPGFYGIYRRLQVLHLCLPEHSLVTYLVIPQAFANAG